MSPGPSATIPRHEASLLGCRGGYHSGVDGSRRRDCPGRYACSDSRHPRGGRRCAGWRRWRGRRGRRCRARAGAGEDEAQDQGAERRPGQGRRADRDHRQGDPVRRRPTRRGEARQPRRHRAQARPVRPPGQGPGLRPLQAALQAARQDGQVPRPRPQGPDRGAGRRERQIEGVHAQVRRPRPRRQRAGGRAVQRPAAAPELLQHRQGPVRLAHRARGDGLPQGQRDGAQLPGDPGDLREARRRARAALRSPTPVPASTSRSTSPSR